jgi:hypothetical protein
MATPISRTEVAALESLGRGPGAGATVPTETLERLSTLGMAEQRGGRWSTTKRGDTELQRRKNLGRTSGSR